MRTFTLRTLSVVFAVATAVFAAAPARADVVSFNFTGQISDSVLQTGIYQPLVSSNMPADWLGQTVSGSIRIDLGPRAPTVLIPGQMSQLSNNASYPATDWMTVSITQPDGSTLLIPSSPAPDPYPEGEGNNAYSHLMNNAVLNGQPAQDGFSANRFLSNGQTYPQQLFQLELVSTGANNLSLVDSIDYRKAVFNPAQANWTNYGVVDSFSSLTSGYRYAFTVLSLSSTVSAVPEPTSTAMMGIGLAALLWFGRRRRGDETGLAAA
ncbi:MAG TPA: PEP-CTERM sorting domain-containing protein [Ideonella sp.]|uniref:PEP-CTERM sorting domain-containing protein n=1 Tax=Ideonella sp. TaxID=1929293 RepID=UPI002BB7390F|nr:PEP-CTERM sorting domain-containing protein [Ideonella sp.]HSI51392.1 PEP-CTERM sorting domain-containing protein [Ideonella sp.]